MNFVLDTCALSEPMKPRPDSGFISWLRAQNPDHLFICTLSLGELRNGIDRLPSSPKKHDLLLWLITLTDRYSGRFLDFDTESAFTWGTLTASLASMGKPMPTIDAMIAACTLRHGHTLVTHNERDYQNAGVPLVNPWSLLQQK